MSASWQELGAVGGRNASGVAARAASAAQGERIAAQGECGAALTGRGPAGADRAAAGADRHPEEAERRGAGDAADSDARPGGGGRSGSQASWPAQGSSGDEYRTARVAGRPSTCARPVARSSRSRTASTRASCAGRSRRCRGTEPAAVGGSVGRPGGDLGSPPATGGSWSRQQARRSRSGRDKQPGARAPEHRFCPFGWISLSSVTLGIR